MHGGKTAISVAAMKKLIEVATDATPGSEVKEKLWEKENPYEARYGENWRREIWNCQLLNHYMPVDFMITHLVKEGNRVFKDTKHKRDWFFYHDALKIMIDRSTVGWMRTQVDENGRSYYDRWLLPQNGLN